MRANTIQAAQRACQTTFFLLLSAVAILLAGCGGSGAGAGGGSLVDQTSTAASITVTTSSPQISSSGGASVTITAYVKDAANRTIAGQDVSFATTDPGAALQVVVAKTSETGAASATLSITDKSNRTIPVVASSNLLTGTVNVNVTGTSLTLSGPSNIVFNAATTYTAQLRDSDGNALSGRTITIASSAGNQLSAASVVTDATGQASFNVTGTQPGTDTLTLNGLGASASLALTVSGTQLTYGAPTLDQELVVNTAHNVTVTFIDNGLPQVGQTIQFSATRGTLSAPTAITDATGTASVTVNSPTAGIATITATAPNGVVSSQRVEFVSVSPSKMTLQASPSTVAVNLSAAGTNSSSLIAVVRDANDNPVKNVTVTFASVSDPSNGRIEPASAITDSNGVASVAFYPGANSTGNNQIVVQAATAGVGPIQTTLTAAAQSISVRLSTGNQIEQLNITTNRMPWNALVVDTNGSAVADATVTASLVGIRYFKGRYYWGGSAWFRGGLTSSDPSFGCLSEDVNENARLDAGEDLDSDGNLEPTGVAAVQITSANAKTDSQGFAELWVNYGRGFGGWTEVRLRVTITTLAGTEGFDVKEFTLPVLASDLLDENVAPPGQPSPFGVQPDCTNPN